MKKMRILSLLTMLLCVALLFAACGRGAKELGVKKIFDELKADTADSPRFESAAKLSLEGGLVDNTTELALFSKTTGGLATQTVFNIVANSVVGTFTETDTTDYGIDLYTNSAPGYPISFFVVETATTGVDKVTYTTALYAANGTKVAEVNRGNVAPELKLDLLRFDEKCYRVAKDGAITEAFARSEFAGALPTLVAATEKYYYTSVAAPDNGFLVFDKELQPVSSFVFPSYANNAFYRVLNNGNVLIQYRQKLPADAEKYDLIEETAGTVVKYTLVQQIFNAKKGSVKNLKTGYSFDVTFAARDTLPANDFMQSIDKSIKNIIVGYKIENNRVSTTGAEMLLLSITNQGSVNAILNRFAEGQSGFFNVPADGVVAASDVLGRLFLYNEKGKLIGEVTGAQDMTESYVIGSAKIYDYAMNAVYDYATEGYTYFNKMKSGVILTKEDSAGVDEYYLYANGNLTKLSEGTNLIFSRISDRVYQLRNVTTGVYTYYNDLGTQLLQTKSAVSQRTSGDKAYLVSYYNTETDQTEFYRVG